MNVVDERDEGGGKVTAMEEASDIHLLKQITPL